MSGRSRWTTRPPAPRTTARRRSCWGATGRRAGGDRSGGSRGSGTGRCTFPGRPYEARSLGRRSGSASSGRPLGPEQGYHTVAALGSCSTAEPPLSASNMLRLIACYVAGDLQNALGSICKLSTQTKYACVELIGAHHQINKTVG